MLLDYVHKWQPFKLDALGIVTLLGASEMDEALGGLVRHRYLEYLPLLGAFVIAGNNIVKPIPGFTLYNVSDGIQAGDVAAWFSRWLNSQDFTWNSSSLHIFPIQRRGRHPHFAEEVCSALLGFVTISTVIITTIFVWDWWGFANAISMVISIFSKNVVVRGNRESLNAAYSKVSTEQWAKAYKMALLITPSGKAVTIYAPCGIITEVLLTNPKPPHPRLYFFARALGWLGFACHVVSLGMAVLINQLITVAILMIATVLVANRVCCDELHIGAEIEIQRFDETSGIDKRSRTYLRMDLSQSEEDAMLAWGLFPQRSNEGWWNRYGARTADTDRKSFDLWKGSFWMDQIPTSKERGQASYTTAVP